MQSLQAGRLALTTTCSQATLLTEEPVTLPPLGTECFCVPQMLVATTTWTTKWVLSQMVHHGAFAMRRALTSAPGAPRVITASTRLARAGTIAIAGSQVTTESSASQTMVK